MIQRLSRIGRSDGGTSLLFHLFGLFAGDFPRTISYLFLQTTRSSLVPGVKPTFSASLTDAMLSSSAM